MTFSRAYSRFISITEYSGPLQVSSRVLREKIRMRAILKESTANYILVESLINVDFGKNMNCQFFLNSRNKMAKMAAKMTMRHSIKQMN